MASPLSAQTLNVASAGDQNMVDYVKDYLGPMFEKADPGVKVVSVGTGPGDSASRKISRSSMLRRAPPRPISTWW
ncbi:hypothetical protein [Bosea thiooxidans]